MTLILGRLGLGAGHLPGLLCSGAAPHGTPAGPPRPHHALVAPPAEANQADAGAQGPRPTLGGKQGNAGTGALRPEHELGRGRPENQT